MKKQTLDKKIVITGGGSGGHVSVAIAFLDELANKYSNVLDQVLYIGGDLAMEGEKSGRSHEEMRMGGKEINFVKIRAGKLQRQLSFNTIKLLLRTILGIFDANKYLKNFKPDLIFSVGGFVSVPVAFIAWRMRIPIYLHEQTAAVGLANKIVGKFAKRVYLTFPQSKQYFPSEKTLHTGNMVREKLFNTTPTKKVEEILSKMVSKRDQFPIVLIMGGGQGSHILNTTLREMLNYIPLTYQIILQTGDNQLLRDYDVLYKDWKKLPKELQERVYITKFISDDDIGAFFNKADLFVGRAGANTVYELGILQKYSILIPIPWVTHNEQEKNAKVLESVGLATVLPEGELTSSKLGQEIEKYFSYSSRKDVSDEASKIFRRDALEIILTDMFKGL